MIDFLFLSNGYGEDAIAAGIAELIPKPWTTAAFPLVGEGTAYRPRNIQIAKDFPPLSTAGLSLWQDFRKGLPALLRGQWKALKSLAPEIRYPVAVGDIFPVLLCFFALKKDFFFVGTAKSIKVQSYNFMERWFMRKAKQTFVRDEETSHQLQKKGVDALWVGNPMMDEIAVSKIQFPHFSGYTVALLPGSRNDAPANFLLQVEALHALARKLARPVRGIAALPLTKNPEEFIAKLEGWDGVRTTNLESKVLGEYQQGNVLLLLTWNCLTDVLAASPLVFGQAGTGNEQAAGIGKPVIAFDFELFRERNDFFRKQKLSWYRWRQKQLLGEALAIVYPHAELVAEKGMEILSNKKLYDSMSLEGKNRMGPPGASQKIAEILLSKVKK